MGLYYGHVGEFNLCNRGDVLSQTNDSVTGPKNSQDIDVQSGRDRGQR